MTKCHCCDGSGKEQDDVEIGSDMRERRLAAGVQLKAVAAGMGISSSMLVFLERGERRWDGQKICEFLHQVNLLSTVNRIMGRKK
jgi:transcriptional regulator with XRE-family HTH domain